MPVSVPTVVLPHGAAMPLLGLGTWPMTDAEAESIIPQALDLGYRLIDTAENYGNEVGVGRGLRAASVPRNEVFVTTKFNKRWHGRDLVAQACQLSADRLGVDYLDLLLIHWPNPAEDRYVEAWEGMLRLRDSGLVRAIGTSNFKPAHLQRLLDATGSLPEVNQIQLNPLLARPDERQFHAQHGIVTESWSPIGGRGTAVLDEPVVVRLAARYGRTAAQIVLRWHVQLGLVAVPKSSNLDRLADNLNIFDFQLAPDDLDALSALDRGAAGAADSDRFGH